MLPGTPRERRHPPDCTSAIALVSMAPFVFYRTAPPRGPWLTLTGNFVGPLCFRTQDAPRYVPGFAVTVVTSISAGVLIVVYRFVCTADNTRRDKSGIGEAFEHAYEDDYTDKKVSPPIASVVYGRWLTRNRIRSSGISCKPASTVDRY